MNKDVDKIINDLILKTDSDEIIWNNNCMERRYHNKNYDEKNFLNIYELYSLKISPKDILYTRIGETTDIILCKAKYVNQIELDNYKVSETKRLTDERNDKIRKLKDNKENKDTKIIKKQIRKVKSKTKKKIDDISYYDIKKSFNLLAVQGRDNKLIYLTDSIKSDKLNDLFNSARLKSYEEVRDLLKALGK